MSINYQDKLSRLSTSLADVITCLHDVSTVHLEIIKHGSETSTASLCPSSDNDVQKSQNFNTNGKTFMSMSDYFTTFNKSVFLSNSETTCNACHITKTST